MGRKSLYIVALVISVFFQSSCSAINLGATKEPSQSTAVLTVVVSDNVQATGYPAPGDQSQSKVVNPQVSYPAEIPNGVVLEVIKADSSKVPFSYEDLQKLTLGQVVVDNNFLQGAVVVSILKAAGVDDFNTIEFSGPGVKTNLTKEQIQDAILGLTNDGALRLAGPNLASDKSITGVNRISVK